MRATTFWLLPNFKLCFQLGSYNDVGQTNLFAALHGGSGNMFLSSGRERFCGKRDGKSRKSSRYFLSGSVSLNKKRSSEIPGRPTIVHFETKRGFITGAAFSPHSS